MNFRPDARGAASVTGTILIVGLTIILAAAVGVATVTFVDKVQNPPPSVLIEPDQQRGVVVETNGFNDTAPGAQANLSVTFTHISGAAVDPDRLSVTVNEYPAYDVYDPENPGYATLARTPARSTFGAGTHLRVVVYGDRVYTDGSESPSGLPSFFHNTGTLEDSLDDPTAGHRANELRPGDTVRLVWTSPSGLNSYVITEYTVQ
jgi:FlaG/FlaF family flagellin (archaellin)